MNIRQLESAVEAELNHLLALCPSVDIEDTQTTEVAQALKEIDQKIEHLISAIAEGSQLTIPYINRAIQTLEEQRKQLLEQQSRSPHDAASRGSRIHFPSLNFEEKKLVAAQFIREIRLGVDEAQVIWNV